MAAIVAAASLVAAIQPPAVAAPTAGTAAAVDPPVVQPAAAGGAEPAVSTATAYDRVYYAAPAHRAYDAAAPTAPANG